MFHILISGLFDLMTLRQKLRQNFALCAHPP